MTQSVTELGLPTPKERRRLREAADLTHEEVAAAVGVTSNTVRSWETGRTHPRGRKLEAYSKLLTRLSADGSPGSAPSGPTARADGSAAPEGPDRGKGTDTGTGSASDSPSGSAGPAQGRGDGTGAAAVADGTPARPLRPAWANGTATPLADAPAATGPAGAAADAASGPGAAPGGRRDSAAADSAESGSEDAAEAAWAATGAAPADADTASAADAPEGRFGLRMMRGLTRPVGAQTRPKAAAKRAAKPPVGMPRHEAKSPVKAGAAAGGHGGGGRAALRPGSPLPPGTGTGTAPDTGSDPAAHSGPRSGKTSAPDTGPGRVRPADPATPTDTTGAGSDPASVDARTPGPDAASDSASGAAPNSAPTGKATRPAEPAADPGEPGGPAAEARTAPQDAPGEDTAPAVSAIDAFEALYDRTAPALTRQAYLLTGRHALSCEAVERAFQQAWERWPEVATDPDPVGWVRAATYEYALSPWHRFRRSHRHPDEPPADPADRVLLDAMLALPPAHRRTVLLYDGVGLDLPDTAAETEASTPTAGNRLVNAHADLADQLPELDGVPPAKQSAVLRERLGTLRPAGRLEPRAAGVVRVAGEHRNRLWTRAVVGVTAVITAATAYTWVTAPTEYEPPRAPGASVSGVPPHSGPQQLTDEGRQLHDKLLSDPSAGPSRISPSLE
ncbi:MULTISPECIES: helix-turn-helix domain-containing protein [unclassified Streptomyces]|uniref:helix-turn-helix domain-containing protein n=1 Tax=unclassified Streptomyces TaxID=2593676 RepID=UPI002B1D0CA6|nr:MULTISPECIES: helix-turn-helix domain-containing protein [unclassified Streptomyces]